MNKIPDFLVPSFYLVVGVLIGAIACLLSIEHRINNKINQTITVCILIDDSKKFPGSGNSINALYYSIAPKDCPDATRYEIPFIKRFN